MKLTEKLLKEQIKKSLKEARTFDQFMYGDNPGPEEVGSDGLTHSERQEMAAEEREVQRLKRKYQSAEDREFELYTQGEQDAQTIVVRSPRTFKEPQHSSDAYMAGYRAGQLEQKKKDAEERVKRRDMDSKKREKQLKATGLSEPNDGIVDVWNMMMFGGGVDTENASDAMFRSGWLPYLKAKKGKNWTRSSTDELKKDWQQGLIDKWKSSYGNMRDIKQQLGWLKKSKVRVNPRSTKDNQFWVDELSSMGQEVVDDIYKKHKSGMLGKAASFLGFEESMTLSSDDIRRMIREELTNITKENNG